jgi:hypothetical protein
MAKKLKPLKVLRAQLIYLLTDGSERFPNKHELARKIRNKRTEIRIACGVGNKAATRLSERALKKRERIQEARAA